MAGTAPAQAATGPDPAQPARGVVCFTWDDAYSSWPQISQMAADRGQRHTFCVTPNLMLDRLSNADVVNMHSAGHEIACHSLGHPNMTQLSPAQRLTEYTASRSFLENLIGEPVTTWTYPYGSAYSPPGRTPTTDQELYLRYDRLLDTSGEPQTAVYPRFSTGPSPFLIKRFGWAQYPMQHAKVLQLIRQAANSPIIAVIYAHDAAPMIDNGYLAEALDLAQTLGVQCVQAKEAFPACPCNLMDPSFEDPNLYQWNLQKNGGNESAVAESVILAPDVNIPGARALHLSNPGPTGYVTASQTVRIEDNRAYSLSFRDKVSIKTSGNGAKIYAKVVVRGPYFEVLKEVYSTPFLTNTGWAHNEVQVPATVGASFVEVFFAIESLIGQAWFDHVHFGPTVDGKFG
ncbi:polysaccharide deacetylase family protein [Arthrobacter sp. KNU-44]|uniref:polysaccharide deacetylase family protein n=1 Tax=Arthrobacter sp. KNU-44 TaxID=3450744 RepID=UPI003F41EEBD